MVMRALYPNAGTVHIEGRSVLSNFKHASKHLGVVTQHNTLWDKLSCLDHLRLFAVSNYSTIPSFFPSFLPSFLPSFIRGKHTNNNR